MSAAPRCLRKRDWWLLGVLLALCVIGLLALRLARRAPADGRLYMRYSIDGATCETLPLDAERDLTVDQGDGCVNVLHLSPDGVEMRSATCHNQSCVRQGRVTLANRDARPLYNLIVCAPHHLTVELLTAEEASADAK